MPGFDVWDVVKVPFTYRNRPVQQHRPALVIAHHAHSGLPALLWVLMITSASHRSWFGDVAISDMKGAGLSVASIVRSAKVATIEAADAALIGRLSPGDRLAVRNEICGLMAPLSHLHS